MAVRAERCLMAGIAEAIRLRSVITMAADKVGAVVERRYWFQGHAGIVGMTFRADRHLNELYGMACRDPPFERE